MASGRTASGTRALVACLIAYLALALFQLDGFPKVWGDESWTAIPPAQLVAEGRLANPVCGSGSSAEEVVLGPAWSSFLPLAAGIRVLGVDIRVLRGVSVVFGLLALWALFSLVRSTGSPPWVASLVVLVTVVDNLFFVASRTVRPEIHSTFVAVAAFAFLYRAIKTGDRGSWVGSGLVIGIGSVTHPICLLLFLGLVGVLWAEYGTSLIRRHEFWVWIAAAVVVFLPYAAWVTLEDGGNGFRAFFEQMTAQGRGGPVSGGLLDTIGNEPQRYRHYAVFPARLAIVLVNLLAIGWAVLRSDRLNRAILIVLAAHAVGFSLLFTNKTARYLTVLVPFLSVLVVRMVLDLAGVRSLDDALRRFRRLDRRVWAALAILLLYTGNQVAGDAYALIRHRQCDYNRFIRQVRTLIPDGEPVWGALTFWVGLHDHAYRAEYTQAKDLDTFRPRYAILYDSDLWGGRTSTGRETVPAKWERVRRRVERLVSERGTSVGSVADACYGNVEVFRIDWSAGPPESARFSVPVEAGEAGVR